MKKITRKEFLNYVIGASGAALVGSSLLPILKFIIPPKSEEADVSKVVAAQVGELALNSAKIFRFGIKPGILINTPEGKLKAFNAVCTHLNCTVQYSQEKSFILCACHFGHFDLDGRVVSGPPPRALEEYRVSIQGSDIVVSKA